MSGTVRNVVSLDSSSSGSSGSSSSEVPIALPFMRIAQIYMAQHRLRRELDYMFEQVDGMQLRLDTMAVEVAALKKLRSEVEDKIAQKCSL